MKKIALFTFILLLFGILNIALADTVRIIQPMSTDLSEEYLREYAADFFSIKC